MITQARSKGLGVAAARGTDVSRIVGAGQGEMLALATYLQREHGLSIREATEVLNEREGVFRQSTSRAQRLRGSLSEAGYDVALGGERQGQTRNVLRNTREIHRGAVISSRRGDVAGNAFIMGGESQMDKQDITVTQDPNTPEARRALQQNQNATQDAMESAAVSPAVRRENERLQDRQLRIQQEMELRGQLASLGVDSRGSIDDVMTRLRAASLTDEQRLGLAPTLARLDALPALNDGFISQGGAVRRISSMDDVLAFKSGGPVDRALGGGRASITININGNAPDLEARVQRAIHKTMRESGVVVEG